MGVYVGTSGWAYKEWKPGFYPAELPQRSFLDHYGSMLGACEINATFYRMQSPTTFTKWAAATPPEFRFATKAHRALSHAKQLTPDAGKKELLDTWLASVKQLGSRLGVTLFQFPAHRKRSDEDLDGLLNALKGSGAFALEFRDASWDDGEVQGAVAEAGGTVCFSETKGEVPAVLPPGPHAYIRLRSQHYDTKARQGLKELLGAAGAERDVYVFAKHEGIATGDCHGGVGLALWLQEQIG
jgi:uncharacterized protein YecE (DUF72 family)